MKNVEPYIPSEKQNVELLYSINCIIRNNEPKIIVAIKLSMDFSLSPLTRLWWHIVTVKPENSNKIVFTIGWWNIFNTIIWSGGQLKDISAVGEREEWKKAQKKLKKKHISDTINKIIPILSPLVT